jgi:hypothetical protein
MNITVTQELLDTLAAVSERHKSERDEYFEFVREVAACSLLLADDEREYNLIQRARALLARRQQMSGDAA